jgi:hypothetical protein
VAELLTAIALRVGARCAGKVSVSQCTLQTMRSGERIEWAGLG